MKQQKLLAALLCAATPWICSATEETLDEIVVTATRFPGSAAKPSSNITVISSDDIRNSPAINLPDILKAVAPIDVRPLYGNMGMDATVDMRGFGDSATSNTLILLDGQRLNPVDAGAINWSVVPLGNIQRIEIIPGEGTVPYGDRATGGVINIITNKSGKPKVSATARVGSYGYREVNAEESHGSNQGYFNISAHYANSEGWRQNSHMNQQAVSGSTGIYAASSKLFLDYSVYKDSSGLPGSLFSTAYFNNPTSTRMPLDSQKRDGYRLRPGMTHAISDTLDIEAELSAVRETSHGDYISFSSMADHIHEALSLTPRLRWQHGLARFPSETIAGLDYYDSRVKTQNSGASYISSSLQEASQKSTAFYMQNSTELSSNWSLRAGARSQRVDQHAGQSEYITDYGFGPTVTPAFSGDAIRSQTAYDLGLIYKSDNWRAYGKFGKTFRFANTDELFTMDPFTYNPVFAGNLRPQHGVIREIGGNFSQGSLRSKVSLYQMDLSDEIGFDSAAFANTNFNPTRRNGLEADIDWRFSANFKGRLSYTYINATFRNGPNSGKELPIIPHSKATAQLTWQDSSIGNCSIMVNHVGDRRYSGDLANVYGKLPGYLTVDLQAGRNIGPWSFTAKLLNAFDRRYAPYAGYSSFRADYYYYPAESRSLFVSARHSFY